MTFKLIIIRNSSLKLSVCYFVGVFYVFFSKEKLHVGPMLNCFEVKG